MLAILLGAGLRRSELASLDFERIQQRDGRWVIVDLAGKQGKDSQCADSVVGVHRDCPLERGGWHLGGAIFRSVTRHGHLTLRRLSPQGVFAIVKTYADKLKLVVRPHDLRRSFAKLAHSGQAPLEQIQLSLGHASVVTTEIYLGVKQNLQDAPCDRLGLTPRIDDSLTHSQPEADRLRA